MAPHLVSNALDLLIDGESGLWHLTNGDAVSWAEFARLVAIACSFSPDRIRGVPHEELDLRAPRPHRVPLASVRGALMPPLGNAIGEFAAQARQSGLLDARQPING